MAETKKEKQSYLSQLIHFYFAPHLRSVFTTLYLIVFGYTLLYYFHNVLLAIRFVFYTIFTSSSFQSLDHLFWGIGFVVSLIIPFSLSATAIFLLFHIWRTRHEWSTDLKWLVTILVILGGMLLIVITDSTSRIVSHKEVLRSFIEDSGLNGRI